MIVQGKKLFCKYVVDEDGGILEYDVDSELIVCNEKLWRENNDWVFRWQVDVGVKI